MVNPLGRPPWDRWMGEGHFHRQVLDKADRNVTPRCLPAFDSDDSGRQAQRGRLEADDEPLGDVGRLTRRATVEFVTTHSLSVFISVHQWFHLRFQVEKLTRRAAPPAIPLPPFLCHSVWPPASSGLQRPFDLLAPASAPGRARLEIGDWTLAAGTWSSRVVSRRSATRVLGGRVSAG